MGRVVLDTSAWVEFFRSAKNAVSDSVEDLILAERVLLTGPVLMELQAGIRSSREARRIGRLFESLPFEPVGRPDWEEAGSMTRELRRKGVTVPQNDILIAAVARRLCLPVLTTDKHFKKLKVELYGV
jgi:predicted nucleic acid-binding protein